MLPEVSEQEARERIAKEIAAEYGITSIPTLVIYRDGIPIFGQPGALPGPALKSVIEQVQALDMAEVRTKYEAMQAERGEQPSS